MPLLDFPNSPMSGDTYVAPNGVTYTYDTTLGPIGVWVATPTAPLSVTAGSITGVGSVGNTLTYVPGVAAGGVPPYSYSYQWKANNTPISGATGLTYVVQPGDSGKTLTVTITATDTAVPPDSVSATTSPVFVNPVLVINSPGSISGTPQVGSTLTYTVGTASGGTGAVSLTWVWRKASDNSQLQVGGTTYVLGSGLVGQQVYVQLTATDSATPTPAVVTANTGNYPTSPATIINPPLNITSAGSITGTAEIGATLTYATGTATGGVGTIAYTWTWRKASDNSLLQTGGGTYVITSGLVGDRVYVALTATDSATPTPQTATANTTNYPASPATITNPTLSVTSAGTITGTAQVGSTLTYTVGTTSGGVAPVNTTWTWRKESDNSQLQSGGTTYVLTSGEVGDRVYVAFTAIDSATPTPQTATANTAYYPTPPTVIAMVPFPAPVWSPTPTNGLDTIPGGQSGTYNGTATSITTTGCVEAAVATPPAIPSAYSTGTQSIATGQTLAVRWSNSALCGGAASGTSITGTVTDGTYEEVYNIVVTRTPSGFTFSPINNAPLTSTQQSNSISITGINLTAYVTYGPASTGASIQGSIDGGTTWLTIPASGTGFPVNNSDNLIVKLTTNGTASSINTAVINIGDGDNVQKTTSTFTVTNTSSAVFPNLPASLGAGPTQIPQIVSGTWADGSQTNLTSTGCIEISLDGVSFSQGPLNIGNGLTLYMQWAPTGATCGDAADGQNITGALTNGTLTNSYNLTLDRNPAVTPTPVPPITGQALSTTATSSVVTISATNAPAYLTYTATTPGPSLAPLTNLMVSINTLAYVTVPASGTTLQVPPGATLQFKGDVASANSTAYTTTFNLGTTTLPWSVTTTAVTPTVTTPTITAPVNGATGLNPAVNSPAGLTVTGSTYADAPTAGASGGQGSSDWQVFGNVGSTTRNPETSAIQTVTQNAGGWTTGATFPSWGANATYEVAYGNGLWIVFGAGGRYSTSTDGGNTWSTTATIAGWSTNAINGAFYANGLWVAVGDNGLFSTSTNGTTWTTAATISTGWSAQTPTDVAYGNGVWVIVGYGGRYSTSTNGTTWTNAATIAGWGTNFIYSVAYGNGRWTAVGGGGLYSTSTNGTAWSTAATITAGLTGTITNDVAYGNGLWIAVGTGGKYSTSANGTTWNTAATIPGWGAGDGVNSVAYGNGVWVAGGTGSGQYSTSTNGTTWSTAATIAGWSASDAIFRADYGGGRWVAVGGNGLYSTSDGPAGSTTLTLANTTDLSSMVLGDTVVEVGGGADATGVLAAITPGTPSITVAPPSTSWTTTATAKDTSRVIVTPNQPLISTNTISAVNAGSAGTTGGIAYKNASTSDPNPALAQDEVYGKTPQDNALAVGVPGRYPMFDWAQSLNTASFNGFNDWYIPAKNELEILYFNLKPTTAVNYTPSGINPNAVPARASDYTAGNPAQTANTSFQSGAGQAFAAYEYWSSSEFSVTTAGWNQNFTDGRQRGVNKTNVLYVRVIRRIPIADYTAAGSPPIGTYLLGGYYAGQISTTANGVADYALIVAPKIGGEYQSVPGTNASLSILGANTDGFAVGNTISNGVTGAGAATGTISAISGTTVTLLEPTATNWSSGQNLYLGQTLVNVTGDTSNLTSYFLPQASLTTSTKYYARVKYNSVNNPPVYSSAFSGWSSFTTSNFIPPATGAQTEGGYFAGQIKVSGAIYNLIVAPIKGDTSGPSSTGTLLGQYSTNGGTSPAGIAWKNANTAETGGNIVLAQDQAYGKPWTDQAGTTGNYAAGTYPVFQWCKGNATGPNGGGGIGGFTDWYIPAKNELEVLYYYLKPYAASGANANYTAGGNGQNPNAVAPEPVSTTYLTGSPTQTTASLFQGTNAQAFTSAFSYLSSSESSTSVSNMWDQAFDTGGQNPSSQKSLTYYARAIRRVLA